MAGDSRCLGNYTKGVYSCPGYPGWTVLRQALGQQPFDRDIFGLDMTQIVADDSTLTLKRTRGNCFHSCDRSTRTCWVDRTTAAPNLCSHESLLLSADMLENDSALRRWSKAPIAAEAPPKTQREKTMVDS